MADSKKSNVILDINIHICRLAARIKLFDEFAAEV